MHPLVPVVTRIRDPVDLAATCHRLDLPVPVPGTVRFPSGECTGLFLHFLGWTAPLVIDTTAGTIHYEASSSQEVQARQVRLFLRAYALLRIQRIAHQQGAAL